ncbi:MAG TPA: phosphocholine cytidylyltransferase family protein, partial [Candidatus Hodarchaeales archaeon]|nr:phosphocholine cytidylyltransferase family protein [Candidatus Hodarchaeales archaeon]
AAGKGSRLGSLTSKIPKCLLQIGEKTMLVRQLECLEKSGVEETAIIVGYLKEAIVGQIGNRFGRMKISYVENAGFDQTNNIYSLWLARDYLNNGCFLLECDLVFEDCLIERLQESPGENLAVLDVFQKPMEGTVVTLDSSQIVSNMFLKKDQGPEFDYQDKFKTVNIYRFSSNLGHALAMRLDSYIEKGQVHDFYEIALRDIVTEGAIALYGFSITNQKWVEIDTPEDLELARSLFERRKV